MRVRFVLGSGGVRVRFVLGGGRARPLRARRNTRPVRAGCDARRPPPPPLPYCCPYPYPYCTLTPSRAARGSRTLRSEASARRAAGPRRRRPPPPAAAAAPAAPPLRTKWTRRVSHPVLIGHAASPAAPPRRAACATLPCCLQRQVRRGAGRGAQPGGAARQAAALIDQAQALEDAGVFAMVWRLPACLPACASQETRLPSCGSSQSRLPVCGLSQSRLSERTDAGPLGAAWAGGGVRPTGGGARDHAARERPCHRYRLGAAHQWAGAPPPPRWLARTPGRRGRGGSVCQGVFHPVFTPRKRFTPISRRGPQVLVYHDLLGMMQHPHHAKVPPPLFEDNPFTYILFTYILFTYILFPGERTPHISNRLHSIPSARARAPRGAHDRLPSRGDARRGRRGEGRCGCG